MRPINEEQLRALIHEVASIYTWQYLASILNYDRASGEPDFTALWERATDQIVGDITTIHQAEHRLHDILAIIRTEFLRTTGVSETDERIGVSEAWDRWLERMEEDGWGEED